MIYIIYYFVERTLYDGLKRALRSPLGRGAVVALLVYAPAPAHATDFSDATRFVDPFHLSAAIFWAGVAAVFLISVYPRAARFAVSSGQLGMLGWFLLGFFWWAVSWTTSGPPTNCT